MKQFDENIWSLDSPMRLLGVDLRRSTTIIRHGDTLSVISPTDRMDPAAITAVGKVSHIVAPTRFHDTGMRTAAKAFPEARLWGVSGVEKLLTNLRVEELGADRMPEAWGGHLHCLPIAGMPKVNEHVLWHPRSATLVTSDLIFNMGPPAGPWTKLFFKLNAAWERPGPTRIFRSCIRDRAAFQASIRELKALPIRRILPAHGEPITNPPILEETLRRL